MAAHWTLSDGSLMRLSGEEPVPATAMEIFEAEFRPGARDEDRPSASLPDLKLSKYPCIPRIVLSVNTQDALAPVEVGLLLNLPEGGAITLDRIPSCDHVVVDRAWYPLEEAALQTIVSCLHELKLSPPTSTTLSSYLRLKRDLGLAELIEDGVGGELSAEGMSGRLPIAPTMGLQADLYPYQSRGYAWLTALAQQGLGCLLGDEMGLGKTLQVIALLLREQQEGRSPSLVIAPSSLLENWRREVCRFAPAIRLIVHSGPMRTGSPRALRGTDLVITSYETMRTDSALFDMVAWNVVALDEAQAIKNPDAQRTRACKSLPRRFAVAITGTPLQNSLLDLWSVVDFCVPGVLGPDTPYRGEGGVSHHMAAELEALVSPLMLRRTVDQVGKDLPPRVDIPEALLMTPEEATEYEALRTGSKGRPAAAALVHLRMFCTHPAILERNTPTKVVLDLSESSAKYQRLMTILEEALQSGERALVYASYTRMIDLLARDLPQRLGCRTDVVYGRVAPGERQKSVDALNESRLDVLVLNPQAGGTGLNITGANHVIHYNLEWNPATVDQATARAHRRGQTRPVFVHYLYYADTVEEVILQRLQRKRDLADRAVKGVDGETLETQDIMRALALSPLPGGTQA